MIEKSIRPDYVMQGKVKNYLGKQKMVKAPKKWKSGPDHPDTELAYITKAEKDLLLKADLHNSLSQGPNKGPSGIISLNSAGSGYGGPGPGRSGGNGGGGGGGNPNQDRAREEAAQRSRQAAQDRAAASIREAARVKEATPKASTPTVSDRVSPGQSMAMVGNTSLAGKTQAQAETAVSQGEGQMDAKEKFISQQYIKPTDIYGDADLEGQKEIDDIRAQRQLQFSPNLSKDKQKALEIGLGLRDPKQSSGIGSFLKNAAMAVVPGLLPAKLAQGYRLAKLGYDLKNRKGVYGTALRLGENLTGKNVGDFIKTGGSKFDRLNPNEMKNVRTVKPTREGGDGNNIIEQVAGDKDVISEGIKKFTLTEDQRKEAMKRRGIVQNILNQGSYQGNELTNQQRDQLTKYIAQIEQYLVPVEMAAYGGRIGKPFAGRSRDI